MGDTAFLPQREYRWAYADECVEELEATSCSRGCRRAHRVTPENERIEWGPGGKCDLLAQVYLEEPIPEFSDAGAHVTCTVREPL